MGDSELISATQAEHCARNWLASSFNLVPVKSVDELGLYAISDATHRVFRVSEPGRRQVGPSRFLAVDRRTGEVRSLISGN